MNKEKWVWFWIVVALIFVFGIAIVCGSIESRNDELTKTEIMSNIGGDLPILALDAYEGDNIAGSFVFLSGSLEGKSQTIIRFSWMSRDGYSYICEIPASEFQRVKTATGDKLTVNFNLSLFEYGLGDLDASPLAYNEIIEYCSKMVTISMTDEQYSQFLRLTYSNPIDQN